MNATAVTAMTFAILFQSVVFSTASLLAVGLTTAALLVAWSVLPLIEEARAARAAVADARDGAEQPV